MPSSEETLKALVRTLMHDVRNQVNGMVLELTDLRERWPEDRVTLETEGLMRQTMGIANRLKEIGERLEPSPSRQQEMPLADAWKLIAPQSQSLSIPNDAMISLDVTQIANVVKELVANAADTGAPDAKPVGRLHANHLIVTVTNPVSDPPVNMEQWGHLPGYTTKRRRMGLGCSYARSVASSHQGECKWSYDAATKCVCAQLSLPLLANTPTR